MWKIKDDVSLTELEMYGYHKYFDQYVKLLDPSSLDIDEIIIKSDRTIWNYICFTLRITDRYYDTVLADHNVYKIKDLIIDGLVEKI